MSLFSYFLTYKQNHKQHKIFGCLSVHILVNYKIFIKSQYILLYFIIIYNDEVIPYINNMVIIIDNRKNIR